MSRERGAKLHPVVAIHTDQLTLPSARKSVQGAIPNHENVNGVQL